jgi:orotidine-5'-phosphate decarboxylase
MAVAVQSFADRLAAEVARKRSQLVVGLDPRVDLMPVELRGDVARFCCGIVDAVGPHAVAVKPQLAFFEQLGPAGMAAFDHVCAYADAYLEGETPRADALTVNAYLGRESVEPFIAAARRSGTGIFVIVKTSNAGGDVQDLQLTDGRPLWHHVASLVAEWGEEIVGEVGLSSVGAVVGATHPRAVADARRLMPQAVILLPGIGAQGGAVSDLVRAFQSGPASALVAASRSIDYAFRETGGDYREAAGAEAARLKKEIWAASGW